MNASFVATLIWVVNIGALFIGLYLIHDLSSSSQDNRKAAIKTVREKKFQEPENWHDLSSNSGTDVRFPSVRISFGKPEERKVVVKPDTETGVVKPQKPDMERFKKDIETKLSDMMVLSYAIENPEFPSRSYAIVDIKIDGQPNAKVLTVFPGTRFDKVLVKEDVAAMSVKNVEVTAVSGEGITFLASSADYEAARNNKLIDKNEHPERVEVVVGYPEESELLWGAKSFKDASEDLNATIERELKSGGTGSMTFPSSRKERGDLPDVNEMATPSKEEIAKQKAQDELLRQELYVPESAFTETGGEIGYNDMNAQTGDELLNTLQPKVDRQGNSYLEVTNDLPKSESHIARRAGVRSGDRVISINGKPVRNASDIRAVVRKERNANVETFVVVLERQGQQVTKTYTFRKKDKK